MFKKRELLLIAFGILVMALVLMFQKNILLTEKFADYLIISLIVIFTSILAKKITARIIDTNLEISILEFQRYWITRKSYLKKPLPAGILLPILLSFLSAGYVKFLAFFQFSAEALPSKVTKKYGSRRFSTVTEWDYSLICFYSLVAVWLLAIIASLLASKLSPNLPFAELAKYAFYYSLCNLIPLGQLDGLKLLMGSKPLYIFSFILLVLTGKGLIK
jgi:hypothetical protein